MTILKRTDDILVGQIDDIGNDVFGTSFFAFLFFDKNSAELKEDHKDFLAGRATLILKDPIGFAEMYGYTDTTGSDQVNDQFSLDRLSGNLNLLEGYLDRT